MYISKIALKQGYFFKANKVIIEYMPKKIASSSNWLPFQLKTSQYMKPYI